MLRTLHYEPAFERAPHPTKLLNRSPQRAWPVQTVLLGAFEVLFAVLEGLGAYRHFEHLRSRGIAHDTALRCALGVGAHHCS